MGFGHPERSLIFLLFKFFFHMKGNEILIHAGFMLAYEKWSFYQIIGVSHKKNLGETCRPTMRPYLHDRIGGGSLPLSANYQHMLWNYLHPGGVASGCFSRGYDHCL